MKPEEICKAPRYRALEALTAYHESTQYRGRPDWWSGKKSNGEVVPLRERAPCIVYPLPKAAVDQLTRFCFGVDKWPGIRIDDERIGEGDRPEAATTLEALVEQCGIRPAIRALMSRGLSAGTACGVLGIRRGKVTIDIPRAQDCLPVFEDDDPSGAVQSLTWCYQFQKTVDGDNGPEQRLHWFRRDIDAASVTQFHDVLVEPNVDPVWVIDPTRTTVHGFGFCPVLWLRNMPDCAHGDIDGASIYGNLLAEFDALNFALSQRHRGIHYFGTPQRYETGVGEDEEPADMGRNAHDLPGYTAGKASAGPHGSTAPKVRRLAPDGVWSYKSPEADVGLVETTGKAFEVTSLHVEDIRSRVLESMGVVLINQSNILGGATGGSKEMSGRFLRLAFGPMLNLIDELRESCWWPHLQSLIAMVLRIVASRADGEVTAPCAKDVAALGAKLLTTDAPIALTAMWGDSFELSPDEAKMAAEAASKALVGKLISEETASRYVASPFGVSDVVAERKAIDAKTEADAAAALEMATALGPDEGDEDDSAADQPPNLNETKSASADVKAEAPAPRKA
jgi:hypothetical protein